MPSRRSLLNRLSRRSPAAPLPSIYDRHPGVSRALRHPRGLQEVPIERIVGTMRHPSQNSADFLPLPYLRGRNWDERWQRIQRGVQNLAMMPPVQLVQIGDEYYVVDGHNRVAAARKVGAVAIDADVTELIMPGSQRSAEDASSHRDAASALFGSDELRQAAGGRQSRTAEHRSNVDELRREQLMPGSQRRSDETD